MHFVESCACRPVHDLNMSAESLYKVELATLKSCFWEYVSDCLPQENFEVDDEGPCMQDGKGGGGPSAS